MEILVCIKQVPDDAAEIRLAPDGTPKLDGVAQVVNAFDTYSLEMATRLKEAVGGEITVVSVGDESARDALKSCLAVGASHAYLLTDPAFAGSDSLGKARILAGAKAKLEEKNGKPFDLVFCGLEATDKATGQTGAQLAEVLSVPLITNLIDISYADGTVTAKQETDYGFNLIDAATPCVVTVNTPAYAPRYPTIKSKLAAKKMPIDPLSLADIGESADNVGEKAARTRTVRFAEPPQKVAGVKIQEETCEDSARRAVAMMVEAKAL